MTREPRFVTPDPLELRAIVERAQAARAAYIAGLFAQAGQRLRRLFGAKADGRTA